MILFWLVHRRWRCVANSREITRRALLTFLAGFLLISCRRPRSSLGMTPLAPRSLLNFRRAGSSSCCPSHSGPLHGNHHESEMSCSCRDWFTTMRILAGRRLSACTARRQVYSRCTCVSVTMLSLARQKEHSSLK